MNVLWKDTTKQTDWSIWIAECSYSRFNTCHNLTSSFINLLISSCFSKKQIQRSHCHGSKYVALFHLGPRQPSTPQRQAFFDSPKNYPFFLHPAPPKKEEKRPTMFSWRFHPGNVMSDVCFPFSAGFSAIPNHGTPYPNYSHTILFIFRDSGLGMGMGIVWGRSPICPSGSLKIPTFFCDLTPKSNLQIHLRPWKLLISKNFLTLLGTHEPQDIG